MAAQEYYNGANSFNTPQQQHAAPVHIANYPVEAPPQYQPYFQQRQLKTPPLNHNRPTLLQDQRSMYSAPVEYQQPLPEHNGQQQQYPIHHQPHVPDPQQPPLPHAPYSNPGQQYTSQPQPYSQQQKYSHQPPYVRPGPQQVHFEDDPYDASSEEARTRTIPTSALVTLPLRAPSPSSSPPPPSSTSLSVSIFLSFPLSISLPLKTSKQKR